MVSVILTAAHLTRSGRQVQVHIEHWKSQEGALQKVRDELASSRAQCAELVAAEHKESRLVANLQEKLEYAEALAAGVVAKEASFREEVRWFEQIKDSFLGTLASVNIHTLQNFRVCPCLMGLSRPRML
jgi:hypothetical protein